MALPGLQNCLFIMKAIPSSKACELGAEDSKQEACTEANIDLTDIAMRVRCLSTTMRGISGKSDTSPFGTQTPVDYLSG